MYEKYSHAMNMIL